MRKHYDSDNIIDKSRIKFLQIIFAIIFIVLFIVLLNTQVLSDSNKISAQSRTEITKNTPVKRGNIYFVDKHNELTPVAINKIYKTIYVDPMILKKEGNVEKAISSLSSILNIDSNILREKFNKENSRYEPLVKRTENDFLVKQIESLNIKGVAIEENFDRYYPFDSLGSHIIGFMSETKNNPKKIGQYGLEGYYNKELEGNEGKFTGFKDGWGRIIRSLTSQEEMAVNGVSLVTTIDKNIQYQADQEIKKLVETRIAKAGSIIVMDPTTGKVLALANYPNYDLNNFSKVKNYSVYKNIAIEEAIEIGSVMKVITVAAGIDTGVITPETTYYDKGELTLNNKTIRNFRNEVYNQATMTQVLEKSINTGAVFIAQKLGNQTFYEYLKKFKVNEKTGIDLNGEGSGKLENIEKKHAREIEFATASYGHGITITPLSLLRGYAAIANGGNLVIPYIVEALRQSDGKFNYINKQEIISEKIISSETAKTVTDMMVSVVERGYGSRAKVPGYLIAGKTGTANIVFEGKYTDDTIQTFAGFFPANDPKVAMLVMIDSPAIGDTASATVTIGFKNLAKFIINYYNIPPTENIN